MKKIIPVVAFFLPVVVFGSTLFLNQKNEQWMTIKAQAAGIEEEQQVLGAQVTDIADKISSVQAEVYYGPGEIYTLDDMQTILGIEVFEEDIVTAFPNPSLGVGSEIKVYRAQAVLVVDAKAETVYRSWMRTIGEMLAEKGIEVGDDDEVEPNQDTEYLTDNRLTPVKIIITRVEETDVEVPQKIEFEVEYQDDSSMFKGETKVLQAGIEGLRIKTYHVRRENGEEVARDLVANEVTKNPQTKVIARGTKVKTYGSGNATWYTKKYSHVAAHNTLPRGTRVKVINNANGKSTEVTVVGGGLYTNAIIDLSYDAFSEIADPSAGVISVRLEKVYD